MAEILCVYRQVAMLRGQARSGESQGQDGDGGASFAIVSYDEKPGIQAIATTAPDRPPLPGTSPTVMRDHEYKRHGTLTLMAGINLLTGQVHALVKRCYGASGERTASSSLQQNRRGAPCHSRMT